MSDELITHNASLRAELAKSRQQMADAKQAILQIVDKYTTCDSLVREIREELTARCDGKGTPEGDVRYLRVRAGKSATSCVGCNHARPMGTRARTFWFCSVYQQDVSVNRGTHFEPMRCVQCLLDEIALA